MIKLIECPNCGEKTSINTEKLNKTQLITLHYGYCFCCQDFILKKKGEPIWENQLKSQKNTD
jgi:hypothetical protein